VVQLLQMNMNCVLLEFKGHRPQPYVKSISQNVYSARCQDTDHNLGRKKTLASRPLSEKNIKEKDDQLAPHLVLPAHHLRTIVEHYQLVIAYQVNLPVRMLISFSHPRWSLSLP
jgi:hypothetical protein